MKEIALEFINIIEQYGYQAYIVGGFVRDYLIGRESYDIDITTSATPKEIGKIFKNEKFKKIVSDQENYGSIRVIYKNITFEITTFRKELEYLDNRHPSRIIYVKDLKTDLLRRDFTINAICMNKDGQIIDPLNGQEDLNNKTIKTIALSKKSFQDDALRIIRSIRFSTILNFKLDEELEEGIKVCKKYLKNISYERKKRELDKIFASKNARYGIELIKKLDLAISLDLENLDRIQDYTDINGIWAMINSKYYKFTKHEKELIKNINLAYNLDNLNNLVLYKYGLYVNTLAGINKGISKKTITEYYNNLPIKAKTDINISASEICNILKKEPNSFINDIYNQLEIEILNGNLENNNLDLKNYIKRTFCNNLF